MAAAFTGSEEPPPRQLRPLRVGEVLDAAIKLYHRNALTMWAIVAVVVIPLAAIQQIIAGSSLPAGSFVRNGVLYTSTGSASTSSAGVIAEIALTFIGIVIVNGALSLCLVDAYLGQSLDAANALRAAGRRLAPLLWVAIIGGIATAIAFVLFILPGVWLAVSWLVAVPVVMFEGINGIQALGRSMRLVRGRWWATFAAFLVALIMLLVVLFLVGLALGGIESALGVDSIAVLLAFGALNSLISGLITYPFIGSVVAVIYVDLRVRKEALDLEMLAGSLGRTAGA